MMNFPKVLAAIAIAALSFTPGVSDASAPQGANSRAAEIALKGQSTGTPTTSRGNSVTYSGTLVGTPTWTRPFADCTGATSLGPMGYTVQPFTVATTGAYDVTSVQNGGWDGYIFIYQTAFDPLQPNTNCVIGDDDGANGIGESEIFGVALTQGVQYFVVTSAFENGEEGTFDNTITGPGAITLTGFFTPNVPVPAFDRIGLALLTILLGLFGVIMMRRHST